MTPHPLPKPLVKRLDRLFRSAHTFHRYAHHPLCHAYGSEVWRTSHHARICRGCTLAALGGALGICLACVSASLPGHWLWAVQLGGVATWWWANLTQARPSKWLTRSAPCLLLAWGTAGAAWHLQDAWCGALCTAGGAAVGLALYRHRRPNRQPCSTCPERHPTTPCSGIRPILRRERAAQRLAAAWVKQAGTGVSSLDWNQVQ